MDATLSKSKDNMAIDVYHIDYETYSEQDLPKVGAYRYAEDCSTEVFMCGIALNDLPPRLWINPSFETIDNFSDPIAEKWMRAAFSSSDSLLFAHNAQFERVITRHVLKRDWEAYSKEPDVNKWRCSAAMARRAGLPSSLGKVSHELNLGIQKDKKGSALINFFCKPQKDGSRNFPIDHPEKWALFCSYCLTDVIVEREVTKKLQPFKLVGASLRAFQLDGQINDLGIPVNRKALENADKIIKKVLTKSIHRFKELTGLSPTQNAKCKDWFRKRGYPHNNMQADTIREFVESGEVLENAEAQEALVMRSELGFAAIKKVSAMLRCVCSDDRVRGCLLFCGASNTGRWSAKLIQPQNFKRPTFKQTALAFELIEWGATQEQIELLFGDILEVIASCIRHFIGPHSGPFLDSDYAAVEARIVCWLAGDQVALDEFIEFDAGFGEEPYCIMATQVFKKPITKDNSFERFIGKQIVLGCGFGMGEVRFQATCESYGQVIERSLAEKAVAKFREIRSPVAKLWKLCDYAAHNAIRNPGKTYYAGEHLRFTMLTVAEIPMLLMKLPSGRNLTYLYPKLKKKLVQGKKKKFEATEISFYGPIPGRDQVFGIIHTYGAKLVENATQATAYDLMANGGCNASEAGYDICMLVHDQGLTEKKEGQTVERFNELLATLPRWAKGLPLKAEGAEIPYYLKS